MVKLDNTARDWQYETVLFPVLYIKVYILLNI